LNGNEVLIAELVGTQDFRGNSGHFYLGGIHSSKLCFSLQRLGS
jgi:hypothetical protein